MINLILFCKQDAQSHLFFSVGYIYAVKPMDGFLQTNQQGKPRPPKRYHQTHELVRVLAHLPWRNIRYIRGKVTQTYPCLLYRSGKDNLWINLCLSLMDRP